MVKVLVTGASGQVGCELIKNAPPNIEVKGFNSSELDITNLQLVTDVIAKESPSLIINAAAYTAVDRAESEVELAYKVNELGVENLVSIASKIKVPIFHISTDYVFEGVSSRAYNESDQVGPTGVYGRSKLAGEEALKRSEVPHIILRTSWVFGVDGNNFVKTMIRLGRDKSMLGVVSDQHGCPTSALSIAEVLWELAERYFNQRTLEWGIYHFSNVPAVTWQEFAIEIFKRAVDNKLLNVCPVVDPISTADYPTPAIRPAWSVLDCSALESLLKREAPDWRKELDTVLGQLKLQEYKNEHR